MVIKQNVRFLKQNLTYLAKVGMVMKCTMAPTILEKCIGKAGLRSDDTIPILRLVRTFIEELVDITSDVDAAQPVDNRKWHGYGASNRIDHGAANASVRNCSL